MGKNFNKLYSKYQKLIEDNRVAFEKIDIDNIGKHASYVFDKYWALQGESKIIEGDSEKITLSFKSAYSSLPEKLKDLIV